MNSESASYDHTSCALSASPIPSTTRPLAPAASAPCSLISTWASAVSGVAIEASSDVYSGTWICPPSSASEHVYSVLDCCTTT